MLNKNLTLQNVRETNRRNIIRSLISSDFNMRRDELASENGISIMTVKKIIAEFLACGVVEEEEVSSSVGRRPKVLKIAEKYGVIACVSLTSQEFFSYQIIDFSRNVLEKRQLVLQEQYSYRENLRKMQEALKEDLEKTGLLCIGISLSVPSAYYEDVDLVNYDLIPEFKNLHLKSIFQQYFGLDNVSVVHDVFAMAQAEYDRLTEFNGSLFYFYIGYGVGGACINAGSWQNGHDLVAGEIGQVILEEDGVEKTLESVISIPGILSRIFESCGKKMTFYEAVLCYKNGDADVVKVIDNTALQIARMVYNISWIINPAHIVVGGIYQDFIKIIVDACNRYNKRMNKLSIRNSVQVHCAAAEDGEMEGCFDIVMEQWIDWVIHSIPELE